MISPSVFQSNYPFISCIKSNETEYVGIIINLDNFVASIYDISNIKTEDEKKVFLEMGEVWWWESNRLIPINVFLKTDWTAFRLCLRTMNSKDVEIKMGPYVSLKEMATKRSKRKSITLVRRMG